MKKKLIAALAAGAAALFLLSACTAATPTLNLTTTVWRENGVPGEDGWYSETLRYDVSVNPNYKYLADGTPRLAAAPEGAFTEKAAYTSILRWKDDKTFTLTTELVFPGMYTDKDGNRVGEPFLDKIVSSVTFAGVSNNLAPYESQRTHYSTVLTTENGEYRNKQLDYRETVQYDWKGNVAKATLNAKNPDTQEYTDPVPIVVSTGSGERKQEMTYKKLSKKSPYIDNAQMFYVPRAMMSIASGTFSATLNVIEVAQNAFQKITVSSNAADKNDNIFQTLTYRVGEENVVKQAARVYFAKNGAKGGKAITCYYSTLKEGEKMSKLPLQIEQEMMVFHLQSVNGQAVVSDPTEEEEA